MKLSSLRVGQLGLSLIFAACGAAGGPNGGGANLPSRGIGPWDKVEETPTLTPPTGTTWANPSALNRTDGVDLYFEVQTTAGSEIAMAQTDESGEMIGQATTILADASQPAVTVGPDGKRWLAWVDADATMKVGTIDTDGQVELVASPTFAGTSPVVVFNREGTLHLFFVQDGSVKVSRRNDEGGFPTPSLVLAPGVDCVDTKGEATPCWDADEIIDIDVRLGNTAADRAVFRLFYTGKKGTVHAFGFAASYNGRIWQRYAFNPVFSPGNGSRSPAAAISGGRYLMYYSDKSSKSLKLGALEPVVLSETW